MNISDDLKVLLNRFFKAQAPKKREMKRVFQWKRYLNWKDLTAEEKLSVKRSKINGRVKRLSWIIVKLDSGPMANSSAQMQISV